MSSSPSPRPFISLGHVLHQPLPFRSPRPMPFFPAAPTLFSGALVYHDLAHEEVVNAYLRHLSLSRCSSVLVLLWRIPASGPNAMTAPRTIRGVSYLVRVSLLLRDFQRVLAIPSAPRPLSFFALSSCPLVTRASKNLEDPFSTATSGLEPSLLLNLLSSRLGGPLRLLLR